MRRPVIAGNWKMFKTLAQTSEFFDTLLPAIVDVDQCDVVIAPTFTALANGKPSWGDSTASGRRKDRTKSGSIPTTRMRESRR